jgi:hypothetical protein
MPDPATVTHVRLCIDANDVDVISGFWVALLDYEVREPDGTDDDWRHLDPPYPALPALTIQPVPEGKTVKNRLHLDIFVAEPEPWIRRGLELGADKLWLSEEPDDWFQVMADPEGNEYCICLDGPAPS